jgi:hypothetical protein
MATLASGRCEYKKQRESSATDGTDFTEGEGRIKIRIRSRIKKKRGQR